jgi:hypothetical protein
MFSLKFDTDNAAFRDGDFSTEIARVVRTVAEKIEAGIIDGAVYDLNGNRIGEFALVDRGPR